MLKKLAQTTSFALIAPATAATGYIAGLSLTALLARQRKPPFVTPQTRFAILVPAHNEESTIRLCLESLKNLDYPASLFQVYVVADNCSDQTARVVREMGVRVYERHDQNKKSKGYALEWLLEQLRLDGQTADAFVFLDADSTASPNFLKVAAAELTAGAEVLQARYTVANPDDSWRAALRYAAMAAINYARPLGRRALGLSAGLKGTGMVFSAHVMQELGWHCYTRAEDAEMHSRLLLQGQRVTFVPDCVVLSAMPTTGKQASSQEMRWEGGRIEMARLFVPQLLKGLPGHNFAQQKAMLDGALEVTIPPISILAGMGGLGVMLGGLLGSRKVTLLGLLTLIELALYVFSSLAAIRAPLKTYRALAFAPFFIVWKVALYAKVLTRGKNQQEWVRTAREAETVK